MAPPSLVQRFQGATLAFEPNQGQAPKGVLYTASGRGFELSLKRDRATFAFPPASGHAERTTARAGLELILDANPMSAVSPATLEPGVSNYIPSADRSAWRLNVPHFGRVVYSDIYPAIDLSFYGQQRTLEYDFRVKAGADSARIQIGIAGAHSGEHHQGRRSGTCSQRRGR